MSSSRTPSDKALRAQKALVDQCNKWMLNCVKAYEALDPTGMKTGSIDGQTVRLVHSDYTDPRWLKMIRYGARLYQVLSYLGPSKLTRRVLKRMHPMNWTMFAAKANLIVPSAQPFDLAMDVCNFSHTGILTHIVCTGHARSYCPVIHRVRCGGRRHSVWTTRRLGSSVGEMIHTARQVVLMHFTTEAKE